MRQRAMLSFAIAGMFILASAAVTRANWYHSSEGSQGSTSEMMSPTSEPGTEAPEVGSYEYQLQMETGNLPPLETSRSSGERFSPGDEGLQVIEQGGITFRVGIDGE